VAPGQTEKYYSTVQNHPRTFFLKGEVAGVSLEPDGRLRVKADRTFFGGPFEVSTDLVVLATGMVPNTADVVELRDFEDGRATPSSREQAVERARMQKSAPRPKVGNGGGILHLNYRQGPELPVLRHGFPDSNFVCFPYETPRTGIYAAGAVRAPMALALARKDARGAVMKAIQCIELAVRGQAVHPRAGDWSFPSFQLQRCTQCKRCTVECPFGALDEDEKDTPKFNP
jgi:quinone-modifying oxidoreductase subunit QmoB